MTAIESRHRPTILVAVERDQEGTDAVALGVALARATKGELVLAGAFVTGSGADAHPYPRVLAAATQDVLDRVAASLPADVAVTTRVLGTTSIVRGLHELAEQLDAALMVLGPTHVGKAARAVRGDVALGMLHAAPCAVAIATAGLAEADLDFATVGVAHVESPEGREALKEAVVLAEGLGARLRILHVIPSRPPAVTVSDEMPVTIGVREAATTSLTLARETVAGRVPCDEVILEGDVAAMLVDAASGVDLLVMGSRGYGPSGRLLLGSVSAQVIHRASCPVVVVPRGANASEPPGSAYRNLKPVEAHHG